MIMGGLLSSITCILQIQEMRTLGSYNYGRGGMDALKHVQVEVLLPDIQLLLHHLTNFLLILFYFNF